MIQRLKSFQQVSISLHCLFTVDINVIFNYINSSKQKTSVIRFDQICLPGMTEECRLGVFVHRDDQSEQKIVFVSDDNSQETLSDFENCTANIFNDFAECGINEIVQKYEDQMFVKISKSSDFLKDVCIAMKEVLNVLICHTTLEQYTCFNFPLNDHSLLTQTHLRSLHEYEALYDKFMTFPRKDSLLTKVYALETYALYAMNDFIIMVTVAHNRTSKDISEICFHIYEDVKKDLQSHFIFNTL